jgi:hypothetical protein
VVHCFECGDETSGFVVKTALNCMFSVSSLLAVLCEVN